MTEFLVSQNATTIPAGDDWQKETYQGTLKGSDCREINLRDALDWLLGSDVDGNLPLEEQTVRKERRVDLLIWLMNLELRLSPYSELA